SSVPIPAEAPVINVTRSVTITSLELKCFGPAMAEREHRPCATSKRRWQHGCLNGEGDRRKTAEFAGESDAGAAAATLKVRHVVVTTGKPRTGKGSAADRVVLDLTTCLAAGALGDRVLQVDPVALGNAEQIGGAPDDIVLELGDLAVGIDQLPHQADDA